MGRGGVQSTIHVMKCSASLENPNLWDIPIWQISSPLFQTVQISSTDGAQTFFFELSQDASHPKSPSSSAISRRNHGFQWEPGPGKPSQSWLTDASSIRIPSASPTFFNDFSAKVWTVSVQKWPLTAAVQGFKDICKGKDPTEVLSLPLWLWILMGRRITDSDFHLPWRFPLSHGGSPKSSKSLEHVSIEPMVTCGSTIFAIFHTHTYIFIIYIYTHTFPFIMFIHDFPMIFH